MLNACDRECDVANGQKGSADRKEDAKVRIPAKSASRSG